MRCIMCAYGTITVYTEMMDDENVAVLEIENNKYSKIELKPDEVDEVIIALQKAKEVLSRGRNTNE